MQIAKSWNKGLPSWACPTLSRIIYQEVLWRILNYIAEKVVLICKIICSKAKRTEHRDNLFKFVIGKVFCVHIEQAAALDCG